MRSIIKIEITLQKETYYVTIYKKGGGEQEIHKFKTWKYKIGKELLPVEDFIIEKLLYLEEE